MSEMKKIIKPIAKIACVALAGIFTAEGIHKVKDANTRKKAMDAAVRENNKKAIKTQKSEEE